MTQTHLIATFTVAILLMSCATAPQPAGEAAVFDVSARTSDGRALTGLSVFRPGQPDAFCMRNKTLACKGEIPFSTRPGAEISFPFTCDDGTEGFGTMYRKQVGRLIIPTHGKASFDSGITADVAVSLNRRTKGETFEDIEACNRL
ncbi:hypothetical protein [Shimia sp. Alg240-R146]|uniref:hypothetical protein n=1 Tax=Shimia sp. Alg240-R146 TaxID=2993449 RepID=UPI0022DFD66B|nr:hypothetical protein [Shimia sp. Alg240-R146]